MPFDLFDGVQVPVDDFSPPLTASERTAVETALDAAFRAQPYLTLAEAYRQVGRNASARRILDHLRVTLAASEPGSILKQRLEALTTRLDGR